MPKVLRNSVTIHVSPKALHAAKILGDARIAITMSMPECNVRVLHSHVEMAGAMWRIPRSVVQWLGPGEGSIDCDKYVSREPFAFRLTRSKTRYQIMKPNSEKLQHIYAGLAYSQFASSHPAIAKGFQPNE